MDLYANNIAKTDSSPKTLGELISTITNGELRYDYGYVCVVNANEYPDINKERHNVMVAHYIGTFFVEPFPEYMLNKRIKWIFSLGTFTTTETMNVIVQLED